MTLYCTKCNALFSLKNIVCCHVWLFLQKNSTQYTDFPMGRIELIFFFVSLISLILRCLKKEEIICKEWISEAWISMDSRDHGTGQEKVLGNVTLLHFLCPLTSLQWLISGTKFRKSHLLCLPSIYATSKTPTDKYEPEKDAGIHKGIKGNILWMGSVYIARIV